MFDPVQMALSGSDIAVIDLDELGITMTALTLMNAGGGAQDLDIDHDKFWKKVRSANVVALDFTMPGEDSKNRLFVTTKKISGGRWVTFIEARAIMNGAICVVKFGCGSANLADGSVSKTHINVSLYPL